MAGHAPEAFTFRERASGEIEVLHFGKRAALLRAGQADRFRARVVEATELELQHLMARVAGNYKRGNERTGQPAIR